MSQTFKKMFQDSIEEPSTPKLPAETETSTTYIDPTCLISQKRKSISNAKKAEKKILEKPFNVLDSFYIFKQSESDNKGETNLLVDSENVPGYFISMETKYMHIDLMREMVHLRVL